MRPAAFALRKKEGAQLDELIAKYRELILASDAPDAVKNEKLKLLNLEQAKASTMLTELSPDDAKMKQGLDTGIEGSFASLFQNVMNGSKSASKAFKDFGASITATVNDLVAKKLAKQLFESLFGQGGVSVSGGGGGASGGGGSLLGWLGSLTSGGSMAANAGASGYTASLDLLNGAGAAIVGLATGTDRVPQDMMTMIHKDEMVIPAYDANRIRAGQGGGQGMQVTQNFAFSGPVTRETQTQLSHQAAIGAQRALRRNG